MDLITKAANARKIYCTLGGRKSYRCLIMSKPIEDHSRLLGIRGITITRLKAINIHTLEELAESSIDKIRDKLMCTSERAQVLVHKARLLLSGRLHSPPLGYRAKEDADPTEEEM
jgi:predicted RecB family nuclease